MEANADGANMIRTAAEMSTVRVRFSIRVTLPIGRPVVGRA